MYNTWWQAQNLKFRRPNLRIRAALRSAIQNYFTAAGLLEVETPILQISPGMEPHLFAFATVYERPNGKMNNFYLHTSPEFAMKKLIAGGAGSIFQFARVFRNRESSSSHHPEFTMLEWYRVGAELREIIADCENLLSLAADQAPGKRLRWQGKECDPMAGAEVLTVVEAFRRFAKVDLLNSLNDGLQPNRERLSRDAAAIGIASQPGDSWDDIFFRIFLNKIEPHLGIAKPLILTQYPACMAALSRRDPSDSRFAERFELYVCGMELANAFGELTDAKEQRRRFEADMALKRTLYNLSYPIDDDFLEAVGLLPNCSGIALGFDRLVMLAAGAERIEDVLWATVDDCLQM